MKAVCSNSSASCGALKEWFCDELTLTTPPRRRQVFSIFNSPPERKERNNSGDDDDDADDAPFFTCSLNTVSEAKRAA